MRVTLRLLVAAAAILPVSGASAQIYKWVDERGVTNYSNQRPSDPTGQRQAGLVGNTISVYTPDPDLVQAVDEFRKRSNETAFKSAARAATIGAPYAPVGVSVPVAPDPCEGYRSVHCNDVHPGYQLHAPVAAHRFFRRQHKRIPQIALKPGAIAGQVVGLDGFIPGNSANARRFGPAPSRSFSRHAVEPSFGAGAGMRSRLR